MKASDRRILLALAAVGVLVAIWILVISPKRAQISELDSDISAARTAAETEEARAAEAEAAVGSYETDYQDLVVLGKAVPADDDAAGLIQQISTKAQNSNIDFDSLILAQSTEGAAAPTTAPSTEPPAEGEDAAASGDAATVPAAAPVAPTESSAAGLPIGATVGPAGLPTMPYDLKFSGQFFDVADFIGSLDDLVRVKSGGLGVDGRLITVDGFALDADDQEGFPALTASLRVTTYIAPADQGATGGATAEAPAAAVSGTDPATTTASAPPVATATTP